MSPKRHMEIDDELIGHLRKLSSEQLKAALEELRKSKKFVRGTKGNQLAVSNSVLTDEETDSRNKETTTLVLDQNSSGVKLRYMVSLYINIEAQTIPNKCTAMQCKMQCRRMMP